MIRSTRMCRPRSSPKVCLPLGFPLASALFRAGMEFTFAQNFPVRLHAGKTLTANQIQFVNQVIDNLTQSGWMRAAQFYESPFTDFSPRGVEGVFDSAQVT